MNFLNLFAVEFQKLLEINFYKIFAGFACRIVFK